MENVRETEEGSDVRDRTSTENRKWSKTRRPTEGTDREGEKQQTEKNKKNNKKTKEINIGTFNIIDGRANRVEMACWHLDRHNVDICFLTETKLDGHHTTSTYGYEVVATKCKNTHQGGVAVVYRKEREWHLEDTRAIGDNIIKTTLVNSEGRTTLVGIYIPPSEEDLKTIKLLDEVLDGVDNTRLVILGDLNINLHAPRDHRQDEIVNALSTYNLRDLSKHYKSKEKKKKFFSWTWRRKREGKNIQSTIDYVLSSHEIKWRRFRTIDTEFDSDHRLVVGKMTNRGLNNYKDYQKRRTTPPVDLFTEDSEQNKMLQELTELSKEERAKPTPPADKSWISNMTFQAMQKKTAALKEGKSEEVHRLGKEVRRNLRRDRRQRIGKVADHIENHLKKKDIIGAYDTLRHWYRKFTGRAPKPSVVKLNETKEVYDHLFQKVQLPEGTELNFLYEGPEINDEAPTEEEIITALYRMRNRKAPGLTGISTEDLKKWEKGANPGVGLTPIPTYQKAWTAVVKLVQDAIEKGKIPSAFSVGTLVIIPKDDKGGVRGIGLLEVIHKLVSQIINLRLGEKIKFLPEVHGFRRHRGTYTAIGEAKMRMQIDACSSAPVYQVYLDLSKAYDSIDRDRTLNIMEKYKIGPNVRNYIKKVWDNQVFHLRQSGFYSDGIEIERGCTQGDTDSPVIFNLIVDAVLRTWKNLPSFKGSLASFYADDGLIENKNSEDLQLDLDELVKLFMTIGLKTNGKKTKLMIAGGVPATKAMSSEQYRKMIGTRRTRGGKTREKETCRICGKTMLRQSMSRHMRMIHGEKRTKYSGREEDDNGTYRIAIAKARRNECPIAGCPGGGRDKHGMYRHFCLRHPKATIIIEEDGVLPRCPLCGYFTNNLDRHQKTEACQKGQARRKNEEQQEKQARLDQVKIFVNGKEIERVREFKYLGRILCEDDDDTKCVESQITKARARWWRIAKILKNEGASAKIMSRFYVATVQAILLYGAESWVLTNRLIQKLNSFHLRAVRHMTGEHIRKQQGGTWEYPDHSTLLKKCELEPIMAYVERRRTTLWTYLWNHKRDIMTVAEQTRTPARHASKILWWNQTRS